MTKIANGGLPAYTTVENILSLIDTLKRKNNNEDEVKALFGKGSSAYTTTKSALRTFGFIEADSLTFTKVGRETAYSQGDDKKSEMIKVLKSYPPYEVFLFSLLKKENMAITIIDDITNFWGKASYGSTERNREDAAKLFMSIVDYCGFGKYIIGRGSNSTRIEWSADIKDLIKQLNEESGQLNTSISEENIVDDSADETVPPVLPNEKTLASEPSPVKDEGNFESPVRIASMPNIVINVDMSDWSNEKMKAFFKYAYGKFEEE